MYIDNKKMKTNNIINSFLFQNSESKQDNNIFNDDENDINKKYKQLEQRQDDINSFKKEEKYKLYENNHKKYVFNKNYGQKISIFSQSCLETSSKSKSKKDLLQEKSRELTVEQFFKAIKRKYEDDPVYFEMIDETNNKYYYRFGFCLFCHHLAFAYKDRVMCVNKCIDYNIKTDEFDETYTLENFLDELYYFSTNHYECNGNIIPMFIDDVKKEAFFICTACDKETFNKVGITL